MTAQQPHVTTRSDLLRWLRAQGFRVQTYSPQGTPRSVTLASTPVALVVPFTCAVLKRKGFTLVVDLPGRSNHTGRPRAGSVALASDATTDRKVTLHSFVMDLSRPDELAAETAQALEFMATVLDALPY